MVLTFNQIVLKSFSKQIVRSVMSMSALGAVRSCRLIEKIERDLQVQININSTSFANEFLSLKSNTKLINSQQTNLLSFSGLINAYQFNQIVLKSFSKQIVRSVNGMSARFS